MIARESISGEWEKSIERGCELTSRSIGMFPKFDCSGDCTILLFTKSHQNSDGTGKCTECKLYLIYISINCERMVSVICCKLIS